MLSLTEKVDYAAQAILNTQYSFRQGALACRLRSALTCLVYDKTLLVSSVDMAAHSSGAVQTLMSVDADRVVNLFSSLHELWSLPLQIAVALCLLYTQVTFTATVLHVQFIMG